MWMYYVGAETKLTLYLFRKKNRYYKLESWKLTQNLTNLIWSAWFWISTSNLDEYESSLNLWSPKCK